MPETITLPQDAASAYALLIIVLSAICPLVTAWLLAHTGAVRLNEHGRRWLSLLLPLVLAVLTWPIFVLAHYNDWTMASFLVMLGCGVTAAGGKQAFYAAWSALTTPAAGGAS